MNRRFVLVYVLFLALGCNGGEATLGDALADAASADGSAVTGATSHVCDGDYVIEDAQGVASISDCTTISGNLTVSNTTLTSLSLPNLVEIEGFFNCQLNPALTSVSLPALTTTGHVAFSGNDELTSLELANLVTAGGMSLFVNKLTSLSLPKLESVTLEFDLEVIGQTPLTSVSLPELATVDSDFIVRGTLLLTDLSLPKLVKVGSLVVYQHAALSNLTAPALTTVETYFRISENPALPTCQAQALLQQLSIFTGQTMINGNNDTGTCP